MSGNIDDVVFAINVSLFDNPEAKQKFDAANLKKIESAVEAAYEGAPNIRTLDILNRILAPKADSQNLWGWQVQLNKGLDAPDAAALRKIRERLNDRAQKEIDWKSKAEEEGTSGNAYSLTATVMKFVTSQLSDSERSETGAALTEAELGEIAKLAQAGLKTVRQHYPHSYYPIQDAFRQLDGELAKLVRENPSFRAEDLAAIRDQLADAFLERVPVTAAKGQALLYLHHKKEVSRKLANAIERNAAERVLERNVYRETDRAIADVVNKEPRMWDRLAMEPQVLPIVDGRFVELRTALAKHVLAAKTEIDFGDAGAVQDHALALIQAQAALADGGEKPATNVERQIQRLFEAVDRPKNLYAGLMARLGQSLTRVDGDEGLPIPLHTTTEAGAAVLESYRAFLTDLAEHFE